MGNALCSSGLNVTTVAPDRDRRLAFLPIFRAVAWPLLVLIAALSACTTTPVANGHACGSNAECLSGFCSGDSLLHQSFQCQDPSADRDHDGVDERHERLYHLDPLVADSDGDGVSDGTEYGPDPEKPIDTDGDGKIDARESSLLDADGDCLVDPLDPEDTAPASPAALAAARCTVGICAQAIAAQCDSATRQVSCTFTAGVPYEPNGETLCDLKDNDCDGSTDEGLDGLAGAACQAVGVCAGAAKSSCSQGKWLCNFTILPDYQSIETHCDGKDNDCDGVTDNPGICNDNLPCTVDTCAANGCQFGPDDKACSDGNPCTYDSCVPGTGCRIVPRIGPCDDGLICTQGEFCQKGQCVGGTPVPCDDGNQCTLDLCDSVKGCIGPPLPAGSPCNPELPCKQAGTCGNGVCTPTQDVSCDDGSPCTQDACDLVSGECLHLPVQAACSDGNPCTTGDSCVDKVCVGQPVDTCCKLDSDCIDNSACTIDNCMQGICVNDIVAGTGLACDDGNACTVGDKCLLGVCVSSQNNKCNDANPCTLDTCSPSLGCQHLPLADGANCDDGDVCNGIAHCLSGACDLGTPLNCSDPNPCTIDSCDKQKGCQFTATAGSCNDGNACTSKDTCGSGSCVGVALLCTDNNPCTADSCDVVKGCVYSPISGICTDGNACTTGDACSAGLCQGIGAACDDNNACTVDKCDAKSGCLHDKAGADGTACSDGTACTVGDACAQGSCLAGTTITCDDGNSCTDDSCDAISGFCKHIQNSVPCNDGSACTQNAVCNKGVCKGSYPAGCCKLSADCDDGNNCTVDACNKTTSACSHTLLEGQACEDGSKCTVGDVCTKGACLGGSNLGCDDSKPCTADFCLPTSGCGHLALISGPCSDGDPCNGLETCAPAGCLAGVPIDCNDNNVCTLDGCDKTGCTHAWLKPGTACSDGSACTTADACDGKGSCKGNYSEGLGCCKLDSQCDDGYACTTDSCNTALAQCIFSPLLCTTADICQAAYCQDGACVMGDACASPNVYAQDFSTLPGGWQLIASEAIPAAGLSWAPTTDTAAGDTQPSLHVGYGNGIYQAILPALALPVGKYTLTLHLRLDIDGTDCTQGVVQILYDGVPLGDSFCQSMPLQQLVQRPLLVTATSKPAVLMIQFQAAAKITDVKRGVWVDGLSIRALPDQTCVCTK